MEPRVQEREFKRERKREMVMSKVLKAEGILRVSSIVLATAAALMLGLDSQTKTVFFLDKKATVRALAALWVLTIAAAIAAGYQLLQLCRCFAFARLAKDPCGCNKTMAWICFLLDQGATYATFSVTVAASQAAAVAVFGVGQLQWEKLCNIYTRFCYQVAAGIFCALAASLAMAVVSSISAHHLFRLYPSPDIRSAASGRRWPLPCSR